MCTLTYFPHKAHQIISSSRDESPLRPSLSPKTRYIHPHWITYPTDISGGGSWIAYNKTSHHVHVLLNGAFQKHKHRPPYGHSRGLIVLNSFSFESLNAFSSAYILNNIEPFTLVRFSKNKNIEELTWDGNHAFINEYDQTKPHIWSSSTLYNSEMKRERHGWFNAFIKKQNVLNPDDLWSFHLNGGKNEAPKNYQICMKRDTVRTLSIMQISLSQSDISHRYLNLETK